MASCLAQPGAAASSAGRPSSLCAAASSSPQLRGPVSLSQTAALFRLPADCQSTPPLPLPLSPGPLSARGASRQLFSQSAAAPLSASSSLLRACAGPGPAGAAAAADLAPSTAPSASAGAAVPLFGSMAPGGYMAAPSSAAAWLGHGQEAQQLQPMPVHTAHFDHRSGQQQLLRFLKDRQTAAQLAQQPPPPGQPNQLRQPGGGAVKPSMSAFGSLSTLPPPLAYQTPLSALSFDFSPPSPAARSLDLRTAHCGPGAAAASGHWSASASTTSFFSAASTSLLCQSPSSSLSSSSPMSLDDGLDRDADFHFHLPAQMLAPALLTHSHRLLACMPAPPDASSASPHAAEDIPALPVSGDLPPGCLLWQQEMERQELWSQAAQHQLALTKQHTPTGQQRRPKQRYSDSDGDEADGDEEDGVADSSDDPAGGSAGAAVGAGSSSGSGSGTASSDESDGKRAGKSTGRRVKRQRGSRSRKMASEDDGGDSDGSSESERDKAACGRHAARRSTKRNKGMGSRRKRGKKRRRTQRREPHSDGDSSDQHDHGDDDDDGDHEENKQRLARGKAGSVLAAASLRRASSLSPKSHSSASPFYSPSPSSFSTSTAGSSSSKSASALSPASSGPLTRQPQSPSPRRPPRRPAGGHRSKLPVGVVAALRAFFLRHISHPFPSELQKLELVGRTGLSLKQVCDWFTNNRKRYWKPYERRMERLRCGLVGPTYRRAQQAASLGGRKERKAGSGKGAAQHRRQSDEHGHDQADPAGPASFDKDRQLRGQCRCGEEDVSIHDWRQMWD